MFKQNSMSFFAKNKNLVKKCASNQATSHMVLAPRSVPQYVKQYSIS